MLVLLEAAATAADVEDEGDDEEFDVAANDEKHSWYQLHHEVTSLNLSVSTIQNLAGYDWNLWYGSLCV